MVCGDPGVHCTAHGVVHVLLSTVTVRPAGRLVTTMETPVLALKFAVSAAGAFIVRFSGVVVVFTVPVNPVNWLPVVAVPLIGTTVPAVNHPLGGLIDPSLGGFAAVVR